MLNAARQFTWRQVSFALKTFVAAMLALYIAFRLNLSQPSWSMTTVYVVSQPFAGMVLAKSLYRILGTLIGVVASLAFVALFANSRELFCLVLALWIGAGTSVTVYLRDAPQAYTGMLAGYSAAIIGLPAALAPEGAFDFAVARCLEIMLGIVCGTLMHNLVLPQRAGDALRKTLDATLPNMARWAADALRGQQGDAQELGDRRQIIATVVSLGTLRVFATLDTPAIKAIDTVIRQFEGKLLSLLALLVSLCDRLALLRQRQPGTADMLRPTIERVVAHIDGSAKAETPEQSRQVEDREIELAAYIETQLPPRQALRDRPDAFLVRSILQRLLDVLSMWREAVRIRTHIRAGLPLPDGDAAPAFRPYRDLTFAAIAGAISAGTVLVASAFWIATAWPNGPTAVTFAGIMCAIMGGRDEPAAAAAIFLRMSIVGAVIAGLYLFLVLPPLTTFPALVIALAPFYLTCGLLLTIPARAPFVMPVIFTGGGLIGISNEMHYDFPAFLNNCLSYVVGIWIGATALTLLRPLGTEWMVRRLIRGMMGDLARATETATIELRTALESRIFDRINALLMRLDPTDPEHRTVMQGGLASLRIALNILALRTYRPQLPEPAAVIVENALAAIREHFARAGRDWRTVPLLPVLEAAYRAVLSLDDDVLLIRTAEALHAIEMTLEQHPGFFGLPKPVTQLTSNEPVMA
ncbi:FUSC family protein [Bradyrhizobium sp. KBS0727]|uniref:FUSC family protein n=1 Tax=unclassified Bradyrhizobium TaxID=2631580 RepID=UPI00110F36BB|nr:MULTISPECIES: FUSC family protein [unclassified Bradyrhizobium]QDW37307.1 FUSC family protein [Bradyrhizobium sp. KBS0725]QDW43910.1 FUSC family protein [Bradyrhizobium sp. KBS0727]